MSDAAIILGRPEVKEHPSALAGYTVLGVVVFVWAGFALTLRAIGASPLSPADVALIRFALPLIFLLPFSARRLGKLRKIAPKDALLVLLGGVPFFFIATEGARTTSAAFVGALIAGTSPVAVALLSCLFERKALERRKLLPLALILCGAIGMVIAQPKAIDAGTMTGVGFLLAASLLWGTYTIGLRRTGLDALSNGLLVSAGSLIVMTVLMLCGLTQVDFSKVTLFDAAPFLLIQGIGVGLISTVGYAFAISRLGASKSATIGSLAPALAALLAVPLLGEALSFATLAAIALITVGVILSNRPNRR